MKAFRSSITMAVAVAFAATAPCLGQYAIGDGTGLDANIQRGSGGVNPAAAPNPYGTAGNDVVTGNVSGGRQFRGRVNYGAPGDFRGRTGSDALFEFERSSTPQAPGQIAPQPYYRESRAVDARTAGTTPQSELVQRNRLGVLDGEHRGDRSEYDPSVYQPASRLGQDRLGVVRNASGRRLEVTASPLVGVQTRAVDRAADSRRDQAAQQSAWEQQQQDRPSSTQMIVPGEGVDPDFQLPSAGPMTDNRIQPQMTPAIEPSLRQRMTEIESRQRGAEGALEVPVGEDAVLRVLRDRADRQRAMRGQTAPVDPALDPDNQLVPPPAPGMTPTPTTATDLLSPSLPLPAAEIPMPREAHTPGDDAVASTPPAADPDDILTHPEVIEAMRRSRGLTPAEAATSPEAASPTAAPVIRHVRTLTHDQDAAINDRLRLAENDVASGRYFDAEQKYRLILLSQPDLPVARVGLIHAQLGAGLIRTASHNLKVLLERHPEFVTTRYDGRLLPSPQRLAWVRDQLELLISQGERERPGIMLAYIGFQTRQTNLVEYGLGVAREARPGEPFLQKLESAWRAEP